MTRFTVIRKCHAQGGSLLVAIPKLWTDAKGLEGGSLVEITFSSDEAIEIRPAKKATP